MSVYGKTDLKFLSAIGVRLDDAPPAPPVSQPEYPRLIEQLRMDLAATEAELRKAVPLAIHRALGKAYQDLDWRYVKQRREKRAVLIVACLIVALLLMAR